MATVTITLGHCISYVRGVTEYVCVHAELHSVRPFETRWTVARQVPLSIELSRQEYWNGLLFPTLWHIDSLPLCHLGALQICVCVCVCVCVCILPYFVNLKAESIIIL